MPPTAAPHPTTTAPAPRSAVPAAFTPARFTLEQYHAMGEAGVLTPADRVELIDGVVTRKPIKGPLHNYVVKLLHGRLSTVAGDGAHVQQEGPVVLLTSEPEPDFAVVRGTPADYRTRNPSGTDCLLVIEVSDTTLARDAYKAALYAKAGVPAYWIVDVNCRRVIAHRGPTPEGYADASDGGGASIDLPGGRLTVSADDLLGDIA